MSHQLVNQPAESMASRFVCRLLLLALVVTVAGSCSSSGGDQPVDQSRRGGNAAEGYPLERALVACYQDHGIDSELLPDGSPCVGL